MTITQINKFKTAECSHCDGTGKQVDHAAIGKVMRELRRKKGISLTEFSHLMNFSIPYLSDLELGKRNWTPQRIDRYREALSKAA